MHDDANEPAINNADRAIGDAHASTNAHTGRNSHQFNRRGTATVTRQGSVTPIGSATSTQTAVPTSTNTLMSVPSSTATSSSTPANTATQTVASSYGDTGDAN